MRLSMQNVLPEIPDLVRSLWGLLGQVPAGRVTTCGALAEALGNPIAAHLGVVAGVPTIGVTKKLLCGQVGGKMSGL